MGQGELCLVDLSQYVFDSLLVSCPGLLHRRFRINPDQAAERVKRYVEMFAAGRENWKLDESMFKRLDELIDHVETIEEFELFISTASAGGFNA